MKGRVQLAGPTIRKICDKIEPILEQSSYLNTAPFKTIHLMLKFGNHADLEIKYERINSRYNELPIAIIRVLLEVGEKYNLPIQKIRGVLV